ncbi:hypothetical protein FD46_GL000295 [Liquorilactobacillus oeni DSM 19972]|uniref:Uncharacterized protein n=1 Tax=Liquorilactobacillus oeni DSM 19972 TaxID=1423777 RepID=A0A0R1MEZ0_9LACO|nr:hypothetical protein FD46_GL000295 [Liquorilactobacillus oeni DSM 19972]
MPFIDIGACYDKLFYPIKINEIAEQSGCCVNEVKELFEKLLRRKIVIKESSNFLLDTINYPAQLCKFNKKIQVLVLSDVYITQLLTIKESFKINKNIFFTYIFNNINNNLFDKGISHLINDHNNKAINLDDRTKFKDIIKNKEYNLIISLDYGNINKFKKNDKNYFLEHFAIVHNVPVIYANLNAQSYLVGPLYVPKKTAPFTSLSKCNVQFPKENEQNILISPLLAGIVVNIIINELNWFCFRIVTPLLMNRVIYSSNTMLENKFVKLYRY